MYRRILVPIDGSTASMSGLRQAVRLVKNRRAQLRLLHVVDDLFTTPVLMDPGAESDVGRIIDAIRADGRTALSQAAALAARAGVKAQKVQAECGARSVSEAILGEAGRWRADLIVMGTHGHRGLNRLVLGSDAQRVLHEAPVPVLLCRLDGEGSRAAPRGRVRLPLPRAARPRVPDSR